MRCTLIGTDFNFLVANVYIPDVNLQSRANMWQSLQSFQDIAKNDLLILTGDCNAVQQELVGIPDWETWYDPDKLSFIRKNNVQGSARTGRTDTVMALNSNKAEWQQQSIWSSPTASFTVSLLNRDDNVTLMNEAETVKIVTKNNCHDHVINMVHIQPTNCRDTNRRKMPCK